MRAKLAIVCILICFLITGCNKEKAEIQMFTLSLSEDSKGHYEIQTDGDYVYLVDVKKNSKELIRQLNGSIKEVLKLPASKKREWSYLSGSSIPDPECFSKSIHSPATYSLNLEDAAAFVQAMAEAGWELESKQGNYLYLDMHFCKEMVYTRVVILENRMKVFENTSGGFLDSWTYINQQLK